MKRRVPKPGLIIALILSIFVGYRYVQVQKQIHRQNQQPPIVERQLVYSSEAEKIGPTPEVKFIIERRPDLGLTPTQVKKLERIQSDWERFSGPKMKEAKSAADKANRYLAGAKNNKRTPVSQVQNEAGPVIALSGELSSARRASWDRAIKLLTPEQRTAVGKAREAEWQSVKHERTKQHE